MQLVDNKPMFGKEFKYVLVLGLLAWMAYTLPSMQDALQTAAVGDAFNVMTTVNTNTVSAMTTAARSPVVISTEPGITIPNKNNVPEMRRRLTPQEVVTLLYDRGFIAPDKLDLARRAVANAEMGSSTPPCPPPSASSTPGQNPPRPCRPVIKTGTLMMSSQKLGEPRPASMMQTQTMMSGVIPNSSAPTTQASSPVIPLTTQ